MTIYNCNCTATIYRNASNLRKKQQISQKLDRMRENQYDFRNEHTQICLILLKNPGHQKMCRLV